MRGTSFLSASLMLLSQFTYPSAAATAGKQNVSGPSSLAFAALIAEHSPMLTPEEKKIMADLLEDRLSFTFPPGKTIGVGADSIKCRDSNVAISSRSCDLAFGKETITLKGRKAHELFATLAEIGVAPEGGAGSNFESASLIVCLVDPNFIKQKSGGGSACQFETGGR